MDGGRPLATFAGGERPIIGSAVRTHHVRRRTEAAHRRGAGGNLSNPRGPCRVAQLPYAAVQSTARYPSGTAGTARSPGSSSRTVWRQRS